MQAVEDKEKRLHVNRALEGERFWLSNEMQAVAKKNKVIYGGRKLTI